MPMAEFLKIENEIFCPRAMNLAYYQQSFSCYNKWLIVKFYLQRYRLKIEEFEASLPMLSGRRL
jgi:hypothetical protein